MAGESDAAVRTLSGLRLLHIIDVERHEFVFTAGVQVSGLLDARRRRWWNWLMVAAAALVATAAFPRAS